MQDRLSPIHKMPKRAVRKEFVSELKGKQIAIRLTAHNREVLDKEKRDTGSVEDAAVIRRMIDAYGEYKKVKWFLDFWEENKADFEAVGMHSLPQFFMDVLATARTRMKEKPVAAR